MDTTNNSGVAAISEEQAKLKAEIERLQAENKKLNAQKRSVFRLAVSEKGGVSVYGMGRFPVTLYLEQWEKIFQHADEIKTFIDENSSKLARRG